MVTNRSVSAPVEEVEKSLNQYKEKGYIYCGLRYNEAFYEDENDQTSEFYPSCLNFELHDEPNPYYAAEDDIEGDEASEALFGVKPVPATDGNDDNLKLYIYVEDLLNIVKAARKKKNTHINVSFEKENETVKINIYGYSADRPDLGIRHYGELVNDKKIEDIFFDDVDVVWASNIL